jgi:hypothetical protein
VVAVVKSSMKVQGHITGWVQALDLQGNLLVCTFGLQGSLLVCRVALVYRVASFTGVLRSGGSHQCYYTIK